jgi:protein-tyrosine sulfotransferase
MTNLSKGSRFIFVGGAPRSGTTLMQNMLDSHPDICGGPEFLHLPDITGVRKKLHRSIAKEWIDEFCSYDDVDQLTSLFIESLLVSLADRYECKLLSEKTPANVLIFTDLMELFPGARFIHMVRDPRAIISSMLQVGLRAKKKGRKTQDFTTSTRAAINYVKKCFQAGFSAAESAPDKVLTVVYEKLVVDSEHETKRICNFLGIEWSRQMMHPASQKHLGERAVTKRSGEVWYDTKTYNRDPEPHEIDKWKRNLTPFQKIMVTVSFRDFEGLTPFKYDFSRDSLSPIEYTASLTLSAICKFSPGIRLRRQFHKARKVLKRSIVGLS